MNRSKTGRAARWILVAAVVAAGAVFALVKTLDSDHAVTVYVATPRMLTVNTSVTSNGKVVPLDDLQVRAAFAGTVEKIFVHVGERVKAGQLLIEMNDPFAPSRYASALAALHGAELSDENVRHNGSQEDRINMQGDLERAQMEQADAEKQLALLQQLVKTGAASQGEVANAEHRVAAANENIGVIRDRMTRRYSDADLSASKARIDDAKASLETARLVLANANVTSTLSGTVYSLPVTASDFVPMGAELMRVTDLSKVQVHAYIDEPEMGQLAMNQPVVVTWDAKPNKEWHGHIVQVPLTVFNMGTRVVGECVIAIDDADGTLLPNTNVAVNIRTGKPSRALTLPHAAVHIDGHDAYVFRVVDGKLARTKVQLGVVDKDEAQIVSGVTDHDLVVVRSTSSDDLTNGLSVTVSQ